MKNTNNIQAGDTLKFINEGGREVSIKIVRVEEKSCYDDWGSRYSWGTINGYFQKRKVEIIREGNTPSPNNPVSGSAMYKGQNVATMNFGTIQSHHSL